MVSRESARKQVRNHRARRRPRAVLGPPLRTSPAVECGSPRACERTRTVERGKRTLTLKPRPSARIELDLGAVQSWRCGARWRGPARCRARPGRLRNGAAVEAVEHAPGRPAAMPGPSSRTASVATASRRTSTSTAPRPAYSGPRCRPGSRPAWSAPRRRAPAPARASAPIDVLGGGQRASSATTLRASAARSTSASARSGGAGLFARQRQQLLGQARRAPGRP